MKVYNTNVRYYYPGPVRCTTSRSGSVKVRVFDAVSKCNAILNLSKQKTYGM
jgi:hypothetical protein